MNIKLNQKKGFTLVELLAVIVLIAIIGMIAVPQVIKTIQSSDKKAYLATVESFKKAAETYVVENDIDNVDKISLETLIKNGLLKEPLVNPITKKQFTGKEYVYIKNEEDEFGVIKNEKYQFPLESWDYSYEKQEPYLFTIPETGDYILEVWGAQGGNNGAADTGGRGGYSTGILNIKKGETLHIYVGSQGESKGASSLSPGGFNGGGTGGKYNGNNYTGGGGGATDIRLNTALYSRIIVAGGGGGSGSNHGNTTTSDKGGVGGGISGGNGLYQLNYTGKGGTQKEGGATATYNGDKPGKFGIGGSIETAQTGGGGGGGWYGGGSGSWEGGGGGSGYVVTEDSDKPSGYMITRDYYMTNDETIAGNEDIPNPKGGTQTGHKGNGYARITRLG